MDEQQQKQQEQQETTAKKIKALESEADELRLMIQEGVTFDVEVKQQRRKPGFWGFFKKKETITERKVFKIKEPTLATLDRLSALWLQMEIDETKLQDEDYLRVAKTLANKESHRLAEAVAVAVLGEDYYTVTEKGGYYQRKEDKKALENLTSLFFHSVKPSELFTLAVLITNVSNLGDFTNSIRLMSATRTSDPTHLIEQQG